MLYCMLLVILASHLAFFIASRSFKSLKRIFSHLLCINTKPKKHLPLLVATSLGLLITSPVFALDARTAAVGGSAIANGYGVHGALDNPASLMRPHNRQQRFHMHMGASLDLQDNAGFIDAAIEQDTLFTDIEQEIASFNQSNLTCDENAQLDTTCLVGTQYLSQLSSTVLDILLRADNQPIRAPTSPPTT